MTTESTTLRPALERAARYRFMSLLLSPPEPGRQEALRALALEIPLPRQVDLGPALRPDDDTILAEHFRLLGIAGRVSCCASDYIESGFADPGPIMGDIAGFYKAFGYEHAVREPADHFANLFAFLALLAVKQAYAAHEGDTEQVEVARDAETLMLAEHMNPYFARFAERLAVTAPEGAYAPVAAYARFVAAEPV